MRVILLAVTVPVKPVTTDKRLCFDYDHSLFNNTKPGRQSGDRRPVQAG